nr:MAG TPA: hypothetical protein [Caudoviricetes sp.]
MPILIVFKHQFHGWTHIALRICRVHSTEKSTLFKVGKTIKEHFNHLIYKV